MTDVRNTSRTNERLHPLDEVEDRLGANGTEETGSERASWSEGEVQAQVQIAATSPLPPAEEVTGARHPGSSSREERQALATALWFSSAARSAARSSFTRS